LTLISSISTSKTTENDDILTFSTINDDKIDIEALFLTIAAQLIDNKSTIF